MNLPGALNPASFSAVSLGSGTGPGAGSGDGAASVLETGPATMDGQPVALAVTIELVFTLR